MTHEDDNLMTAQKKPTRRHALFAHFLEKLPLTHWRMVRMIARLNLIAILFR
ncbi:MAG TPA: hypothetical protein VK979_00755 [Guyparkeria sp.]|nr:hypothetical protein [Guyparkeria sp.]